MSDSTASDLQEPINAVAEAPSVANGASTSNGAISNLQQAIKAAAAGPFVLNAAFLTAGLKDPSVTVPAGYDKDLALAFHLTGGAKFTVGASAANVGEVSGNSFTVTQATVPLVASTKTTPATLVFGISADGTTLVVQIASAPSAWSWTDSFPAMTGFPFASLAISGVQLIFSSASGTYPLNGTGTAAAGQSVAGGPSQNLFGSIFAGHRYQFVVCCLPDLLPRFEV